MKGHWNFDGSCSVCGQKPIQSYMNFCSNCGAQMKEEVDIVYISNKLTINTDTPPDWDYSLPTIINIENGASLPHIESKMV